MRDAAPASPNRRARPRADLLLAAGVMVQAVWFEDNGDRAGRLLLTIHHLAVDGVSWRILVPDLAAAWEAVAAGRTLTLLAARDLIASLGAASCGACAGSAAKPGAFVLDCDVERAGCVLVERPLDRDRDTAGTARPPHAHLAGCGHAARC